MTENLVRIQSYAIMKGVTQMTVRNWITSGKVKSIKIDDVAFVVLTDEEVQERKSLFSQHPTKGLHRIGDVMNAVLNGNVEE